MDGSAYFAVPVRGLRTASRSSPTTEITKRDPILRRDAKLRLAVERLVEAYRPERVYLFGSVACGDAGPDSDYGLLLVVPDDAPPEQRRSRLAYETLWGTGVAVDALVCIRSWFETRTHLRASLPGTVLQEGRLLYAA